MTHEEFTAIVEKRLKACRETLIPKGKEYSRNGDRLWNFKVAGRIDGQTPERALWGMWKKHIVSVMDIINDLNIQGETRIPSPDTIAEKFGDLINYALLLEALIEERRPALRASCVPEGFEKQPVPPYVDRMW